MLFDERNLQVLVSSAVSRLSERILYLCRNKVIRRNTEPERLPLIVNHTAIVIACIGASMPLLLITKLLVSRTI